MQDTAFDLDAAAEVLAQRRGGQVEEGGVLRPLVQPDEEQGGPGRAAGEACVRVLATADLGDVVLRADPVGDCNGDLRCRLGDRCIARDRCEVQQVEPDARQAAEEVEAEPVVPVTHLVYGDVQHLERLGAVAEALEHVGDAVEAVVEAEAAAGLGVDGPLYEPLLVVREAAGAGCVEGVQHPSGAVGHVHATGGELLDVAREEPVVPLRGGTGQDGGDHGVAGAGPAVVSGSTWCRERPPGGATSSPTMVRAASETKAGGTGKSSTMASAIWWALVRSRTRRLVSGRNRWRRRQARA